MIWFLGFLGALIAYLFFRNSGSVSGFPGSGVPDFSGSGAPSGVLNKVGLAVEASRKFDVPLTVLLAQMWTESNGNQSARGSAGEFGVMQLKQIAVDDVVENGGTLYPNWQTDARDNIFMGAQYLKLNLKPGRANGDIRTALKMYNQGPSGYLTNPVLANQYATKVLNRSQQLKNARV